KLMRSLLQRWEDSQRAPQLHIVGEPANLKESDIVAMAKAESLVIGEDIVITARRLTDLPAHLSSAAMGLIYSLGCDGICRVAEELLLCVCPVAVSGVGAFNEVFFDNAACSLTGLGDDEIVAKLSEWLIRSIS